MSEFMMPDSVEGLREVIRSIDEKIRESEEKSEQQAGTADARLLELDTTRVLLRGALILQRDKQCQEAICELPNAVLDKLPREIRDMIYEALCGEVPDEPYEVVDNNSSHPHDVAYEFAPMVKGYEPPYWMLGEEVGHEFAQEAVEIWYKHAHLSVNIKLLQPLLQDDDGVLYDSWTPSTRTCDFVQTLDVVVGPALRLTHEFSRPSSQAVHIRQVCHSLSTLLEERSVARKEGFKLHIAFRWYAVDHAFGYVEAICPVVYRLRAQGFLVSSSQAYGDTITTRCGEADCECNPWRLGDVAWDVTDDADWFDGSEEECMKRIEKTRAHHMV